jgi:hypothetical protein
VYWLRDLTEEDAKTAFIVRRVLAWVSLGSGVLLWAVLLITWDWEANEGRLQEFLVWVFVLATLIAFLAGVHAVFPYFGSKSLRRAAAGHRSGLVAWIAAWLGLLLGVGGMYVLMAAYSS